MGCTERQGRKAPQKLGLFALGIVVSILVLASAASARTIELMKYDGTFPAASFDGSGSVGGPPLGGQNALAVHNETGNIYVGSLGSTSSTSSTRQARRPRSARWHQKR